MKLIGIAGKAGAGKDAVAEILSLRFGFVRVALADPLKRIAMGLWRFNDEQLWGPSESRNAPDLNWPKDHVWTTPVGKVLSECQRCGQLFGTKKPCLALSPREALQVLGTEVGRQIHPNTWTAYLISVVYRLTEDHDSPSYDREIGIHYKQVRREDSHYRGVVVPDVRFPNEAEAIQEAGGKIWLIDRPGAGLRGSKGAHKSETALDSYGKFDESIANTGTLEDLQKRICEIMGEPT